jgi:hypothetical protein
LATPFNAEVLMRAGVSESLVPRVLKSLEVLELIDGEGNPTPYLEALRRATSEEYKPKLAEIVKAVYAEVFQFADPTKDDMNRIADAFRAFNPIGQRGRMVTLFMGLCEEAGIVTPSSKKAGQKTGQVSVGATINVRKRAGQETSRPASVKYNVRADHGGLVPEGVLGFIRDIRWQEGASKEQREKLRTTFGVLLELYLPIVSAANAEPDDEDDKE